MQNRTQHCPQQSTTQRRDGAAAGVAFLGIAHNAVCRKTLSRAFALLSCILAACNAESGDLSTTRDTLPVTSAADVLRHPFEAACFGVDKSGTTTAPIVYGDLAIDPGPSDMLGAEFVFTLNQGVLSGTYRVAQGWAGDPVPLDSLTYDPNTGLLVFGYRFVLATASSTGRVSCDTLWISSVVTDGSATIRLDERYPRLVEPFPF